MADGSRLAAAGRGAEPSRTEIRPGINGLAPGGALLVSAAEDPTGWKPVPLPRATPFPVGRPRVGQARPTASRGRRQRYNNTAGWPGTAALPGTGRPESGKPEFGRARPTASRGRRQRYNGPRSAAADAPGTIQPRCCQEGGKVAGRRLFLPPSRGSRKCSAFPQITRICIRECWYQGRSWSSSRFGSGAWETKFMLSMPASKRR